MAKKKHHPYVHTHITHHDDGSHTIHHEHHDGKSHKSYAVADHDGMMDGLMDHTSAPNPGEAEASSGGAAAPGLPAGGVPVTAGA
jgi:hypothetical protein